MNLTDTKTKEIIFSLVEKYGLYVIPLHSINENGFCTCGNNNCNSPGKHPFFKHNWKNIATDKIDKITYWDKKYKQLNWAILTGKKSKNGKYLCVIDIDEEKHELIDKVKNTFSYTTGNGFHFWFWSDVVIKNSVSSIGSNVDVRGKNGYVVVPPSKHILGKQYSLHQELYEVIDLPNFLLEKENISKKETQIKNTQKKSINFHKQDIKEIRESLKQGIKIKLGTRNTTIHRLLSSDRSKGFGRDELTNFAFLYREMCVDKETMTYYELDNIISSVMKYPPYSSFKKQTLEITDLDESFFNHIKSSNIINCTLFDIQNWRKCYINKLKIKNYTTYSCQELSSILKNKGIQNKRLKTGNVWFCYYDFNL